MSEKVEVELLRRLEAITVEHEKEREELDRLRRLVSNGTHTLNVAHEEELARMQDHLSAAKRRKREALAELDDALQRVQQLTLRNQKLCEAFDCRSSENWRFREALERIGNEYHWDDSPAGRLAREALGKPSKEKRDG